MIMQLLRHKNSLNNYSLKNTTTVTLLDAGHNYVNCNYTVKTYVDHFGHNLTSHEYLDEYIKVVKYVMWTIDMHQKDANAYRWRYKGKK